MHAPVHKFFYAIANQSIKELSIHTAQDEERQPQQQQRRRRSTHAHNLSGLLRTETLAAPSLFSWRHFPKKRGEWKSKERAGRRKQEQENKQTNKQKQRQARKASNLDPCPIERGFIKASDFIHKVFGSFEALFVVPNSISICLSPAIIDPLPCIQYGFQVAINPLIRRRHHCNTPKAQQSNNPTISLSPILQIPQAPKAAAAAAHLLTPSFNSSLEDRVHSFAQAPPLCLSLFCLLVCLALSCSYKLGSSKLSTICK
jgi:hypothetical protein